MLHMSENQMMKNSLDIRQSQQLLKYFLEAGERNKLVAAVTGKRKRGLVVQAKFKRLSKKKEKVGNQRSPRLKLVLEKIILIIF